MELGRILKKTAVKFGVGPYQPALERANDSQKPQEFSDKNPDWDGIPYPGHFFYNPLTLITGNREAIKDSWVYWRSDPLFRDTSVQFSDYAKFVRVHGINAEDGTGTYRQLDDQETIKRIVAENKKKGIKPVWENVERDPKRIERLLEQKFADQITFICAEVSFPLWALSRIKVREKEYKNPEGVNGRHFITTKEADLALPSRATKADYYRNREYLRDGSEVKTLALPKSTDVDAEGILKRLFVLSQAFKSNPAVGVDLLKYIAKKTFDIPSDQMGLGFLELLYDLKLDENPDYSNLVAMSAMLMVDGLGPDNTIFGAIEKYGKYSVLLDPKTIRRFKTESHKSEVKLKRSKADLGLEEYTGQEIVSETESRSLSYQASSLTSAIVQLPEYRNFPIVFRFIKRSGVVSQPENVSEVSGDLEKKGKLEAQVRVLSRNIGSIVEKVGIKFVSRFNKNAEGFVRNSKLIGAAKLETFLRVLETADSLGISSPKLKRIISLVSSQEQSQERTAYLSEALAFMDSDILKPFRDAEFYDYINAYPEDLGLYLKAVISKFSKEVIRDKGLETTNLSANYNLSTEQIENLLVLKAMWYELSKGDEVTDAIVKRVGVNMQKIYEDRDRAYREVGEGERKDAFNQRKYNEAAKNLDKEKFPLVRPYVQKNLMLAAGVAISLIFGHGLVSKVLSPNEDNKPRSEQMEEVEYLDEGGEGSESKEDGSSGRRRIENPNEKSDGGKKAPSSSKESPSTKTEKDNKDESDKDQLYTLLALIGAKFSLEFVQKKVNEKRNKEETKTKILYSRLAEFSNYIRYFFVSKERTSGDYTNQVFLKDISSLLDKEGDELHKRLGKIEVNEVNGSEELSQVLGKTENLTKLGSEYLAKLILGKNEEFNATLKRYPNISNAISEGKLELLPELLKTEGQRVVSCINVLALEKDVALMVKLNDFLSGKIEDTIPQTNVVKTQQESVQTRIGPLSQEAYTFVYELLHTEFKQKIFRRNRDTNLKAVKKLLTVLQDSILEYTPGKRSNPFSLQVLINFISFWTGTGLDVKDMKIKIDDPKEVSSGEK